MENGSMLYHSLYSSMVVHKSITWKVNIAIGKKIRK